MFEKIIPSSETKLQRIYIKNLHTKANFKLYDYTNDDCSDVHSTVCPYKSVIQILSKYMSQYHSVETK